MTSNKKYKALNSAGVPYTGVFYRIRKRIGKEGNEKVYHVTFKRDGKKIETKVGRQYLNQMTPAKANNERVKLINGAKTQKEKREFEKAKKAVEKNIYSINRLWLEYAAQRIKNNNFTKDENRYQKYVKFHFGNKETKEIYPLDVDRVRLKYLKTHSPQTVKHILALLKRLINFGVKKGLCPPLSFIIEMPKVNNIKDDSLSDDQLRSLLNAIKNDNHPYAGNIMLLALFTGMRRGSLFNLKWSDVDFEKGFITLRDPKPGKNDIIPLNDQARSILEDHIRTESEYVFPGRGGRKRTNAQKSINNIKKAAGLPKNTRPLHSLRHTFASLAVSSGEIDLYTLQKLTTHKTFSQLQRYAHLADKRVKQGGITAGNAIEKAMGVKQKIINIENKR